MVNRGTGLENPLGGFSFSLRGGAILKLDSIKKFIREEDLIVWRSLGIAVAITVVFYIFVLLFAK